MANALLARLDYIYFVYGLVLLLLGAVCVSVSRAGSLRTDWRLLGLFAFAHGAAEWLHLLAVATGDPQRYPLPRAALHAVAFLLLLEFARQTHQLLEKTRVSPWIHALAVVPAIGLALLFSTDGLFTALRLFLATPATFWTAALFLRASARTEALGGGASARRARIAGGLHLAAFGLAAGLVVPQAPYLPASWPSPESFLAATGVPVQVVRAFLVSGMALSVWALVVSFDPKGSVLRKRRLLFWVIATSLSAVLAAGWVFTDWLGKLNDQYVRAEAESSAAQVLDHLLDEMADADGGASSMAELVRQFRVAEPPIDRERLDAVVDSAARAAEGWVAFVLDAGGTVIATSNRDEPGSLLGRSFAGNANVGAAWEWRPGRSLALDRGNRSPAYFAAEPVHRADGTLVAVAVVRRGLSAEQLGPMEVDGACLVTAEGRVVVSNRPDQLGRLLWRVGAAPAAAGAPEAGPPLLDRVLPVEGGEWVTLAGRRHLAVRSRIPAVDWTLVVLASERSEAVNRVLGIVITLLLSVVVLGVFVAMQRQFSTEAVITARRRQAEGRAAEFARKADTDALTGVLNRLGFNGALGREFERARRYGQPLSVVMLDLDHFKRVNDLHGHPAGDRVLIGVARLVEANVRESDLVTRWGGEEFAVLAPMTDIAGAARLAEKLRLHLERTSHGEAGVVTGSFGAAELRPADTLESFLHRADQALYRVKNGGRNGVACASSAEPGEAAGPGPAARPETSLPRLYPGVGFDHIDPDHFALGEALEALVAQVDAGAAAEVQAALELVLARAETHFGLEQRLMAAHDYPLRLRHQEVHELFLDDARRFLEELRENGATLSFRRWARGRLVEWFRNHVRGHDAPLSGFLEKAGREEPPAGPGRHARR